MYTRITKQNVTNYPIGTKVRFNYGCPDSTGGWDDWDWEDEAVQEETGWVCGYEVDKWGARLHAYTDGGRKTTISGFTTNGIGTYLV
jgi:hypothetical protein